MAGPDDGWEDVTDPLDVPTGVRKALGVEGLRAATGGGSKSKTDASGGGKPLPQWAEKKYSKPLDQYAALKGSAATFNDDFAGNTLTGDLENRIQGKFGGFGTEGQRDWWATFRTNDNKIRNELFGATLTPSEQKAYSDTTVDPSMDPAEIRRNLGTRAEIVRKALTRTTGFLRAQGYSPGAIDALAGEYAPDFNPELRAQQEGGDPASTPAAGGGDGSAPPPPGGPPPGVTERLVFNDELPPQISGARELSPEQNAAMQAVLKSGGTKEQFMALAATFGAQPDEKAVEAAVAFYADPKNRKIDPTILVDNEVKPVDAGDGALGAAARGAGNALTLGFMDEVGAVADVLQDDVTYDQALDRRRGLEVYDEQENSGARFAGQVVGSLPLGGIEFAGARVAARAAGVGAMRAGLGREAARSAANLARARAVATEAAAIGGVYGFGDAEGGLGDRALGAGVGAAVGGALGGAASYGGGRFAQRLAARSAARAGRAPTEGQEALAAAERQGITPFPADVGGAVIRRATSATAQTIGGVQPIVAGARATVDSAEAVRNRVAASIGTATTPEAAGETARAGANGFIARTGQQIGRIYDAAHSAARGASVDTPMAVRTLDQEIAALAETPGGETGLARLQGLRDALARPNTIRGLRGMRTALRDEFESSGLRGSNIERIAMRVVDAASSDIVTGLRSRGLTQAARLYRDADRQWRQRLEVIDDALEPILGRNVDNSGEQVMTALKGAMAGNNRRFATFLGALPPNEQSTVRASLIQGLGRATKGNQDETGEVFSLSTFLSNWDDIGPSAKQTLFGAEGRAAINDLATYASSARNAQRFANHSNSGGVGINFFTFLSGAGGLASTGGTIAAEYGLGRLLSSPRFARWLARPPRAATPTAQRVHIQRLTRIARAEPAIANDVLALQARLADAFGGSPARLAAQERGDRGASVEGQKRDGDRPRQGAQP